MTEPSPVDIVTTYMSKNGVTVARIIHTLIRPLKAAVIDINGDLETLHQHYSDPKTYPVLEHLLKKLCNCESLPYSEELEAAQAICGKVFLSKDGKFMKQLPKFIGGTDLYYVLECLQFVLKTTYDGDCFRKECYDCKRHRESPGPEAIFWGGYFSAITKNGVDLFLDQFRAGFRRIKNDDQEWTSENGWDELNSQLDPNKFNDNTHLLPVMRKFLNFMCKTMSFNLRVDEGDPKVVKKVFEILNVFISRSDGSHWTKDYYLSESTLRFLIGCLRAAHDEQYGKSKLGHVDINDRFRQVAEYRQQKIEEKTRKAMTNFVENLPHDAPEYQKHLMSYDFMKYVTFSRMVSTTYGTNDSLFRILHSLPPGTFVYPGMGAPERVGVALEKLFNINRSERVRMFTSIGIVTSKCDNRNINNYIVCSMESLEHNVILPEFLSHLIFVGRQRESYPIFGENKSHGKSKSMVNYICYSKPEYHDELHRMFDELGQDQPTSDPTQFEAQQRKLSFPLVDVSDGLQKRMSFFSELYNQIRCQSPDLFRNGQLQLPYDLNMSRKFLDNLDPDDYIIIHQMPREPFGQDVDRLKIEFLLPLIRQAKCVGFRVAERLVRYGIQDQNEIESMTTIDCKKSGVLIGDLIKLRHFVKESSALEFDLYGFQQIISRAGVSNVVVEILGKEGIQTKPVLARLDDNDYRIMRIQNGDKSRIQQIIVGHEEMLLFDQRLARIDKQARDSSNKSVQQKRKSIGQSAQLVESSRQSVSCNVNPYKTAKTTNKSSSHSVQVESSTHAPLQKRRSINQSVQVESSTHAPLQMRKSSSHSVQVECRDDAPLQMRKSSSHSIQVESSTHAPLQKRKSINQSVQVECRDGTGVDETRRQGTSHVANPYKKKKTARGTCATGNGAGYGHVGNTFNVETARHNQSVQLVSNNIANCDLTTNSGSTFGNEMTNVPIPVTASTVRGCQKNRSNYHQSGIALDSGFEDKMTPTVKHNSIHHGNEELCRDISATPMKARALFQDVPNQMASACDKENVNYLVENLPDDSTNFIQDVKCHVQDEAHHRHLEATGHCKDVHMVQQVDASRDGPCSVVRHHGRNHQANPSSYPLVNPANSDYRDWSLVKDNGMRAFPHTEPGTCFPETLLKLTEDNPEIIAFTSHGRSLKIVNMIGFLADKQGRKNFRNNLWKWGFMRFNKILRANCEFWHPMFLKDRPDLMYRMAATQDGGSQVAPPEFLKMAKITLAVNAILKE